MAATLGPPAPASDPHFDLGPDRRRFGEGREAERGALQRFSRRYIGLSLAMIVVIVATHVTFRDAGHTFIAISLALLAMNWQLLVILPRLMNPLLARDARQDPVGARQRMLAYRLTWGRTGVLMSNIVVIGSLVIAHLHLA